MLQDSRTLCSGREDGGGIYTDVGPGQLSGDENAKTHDSQALVVWRGWFVYSVQAMGVEPPRRAALAAFGVQLLLLALAWGVAQPYVQLPGLLTQRHRQTTIGGDYFGVKNQIPLSPLALCVAISNPCYLLRQVRRNRQV